MFRKKKKKPSTTTVGFPKVNQEATTTTPLNIQAFAKFKFEATRHDELSLEKGFIFILIL